MPTKSISRPLLYNENKVTQHKAEFIHMRNFFQDINRLTYGEKFHRFQHLNDLNTRAKLKMLHITLNFEPSEKLSNRQLAHIADRYMEGLRMEQHPYLVYRHRDANHPHIHIITSLIRPDGTRVNTHRMGTRLSAPTRKNIEHEFGLQPSRHKRHSKILSVDELQKITANADVPVTQSMNRIISTVIRNYHFANLNEYNAILRGYNVTAETGSPGSKTRLHNGIYYVALDDQGNKISPPIMASRLSGRPTLSRLNDKFRQPASSYIDNLSSIRERINWAFDHQHRSIRGLVSHLQAGGIAIVVPPSNGRNSHDHIYVDHRTRTAVSGHILGPSYTGNALYAHIARRTQSVYLKKQQEAPSGTMFNANVPQVLSALLDTHPSLNPGTNSLQQDKVLGSRHKR